MNETKIKTDATTDPGDANEELAILLGCKEVNLASGELVTVREYGGFMEGMRVDAIAAPLMHELGDLFERMSNGEQFSLQALSGAFGAHPQAMAQLLAMACDRDREWVESLSDDDGQLLLMVWWSVNQGFFLRRLVKEKMAREVAADMQKAGEASPPA